MPTVTACNSLTATNDFTYDACRRNPNPRRLPSSKQELADDIKVVDYMRQRLTRDAGIIKGLLTFGVTRRQRNLLQNSHYYAMPTGDCVNHEQLAQ